jgi:menaquinol-cytochrome c reductase cytochrome b subunit
VGLIKWLDERYPFTRSVDAELYRRIPNYAGAFYYYLGGLAFILVVIEFLTGFLLGLYYVPDASGNPAPAYTSVNFIQQSAYLGWLVRGMHFWGANLLIVILLLHMARVFWTGSYRAPREINWMVGVVIFLIVIALSITGELLPWNTSSYFARSRELSIATGGSALPQQLTTVLKELLQGGPIVGPATLQRFFMAHVFLLPALITVLMYIHFRLIRAHGIAEPM